MRKNPEHLPPLDLLGTFEAAARHLSFTKAGAERFVTQSAISRQIKALEDDLGVALFRRKHRALALTEDGHRLYETCTTALSQLRGTVARIRAPDTRQVLALTTTPGVASLWLIPRLALFTKAHPGIDVRLDASLRRRELAADGFDLAIRYARVNAPYGTPLGGESMLGALSLPVTQSQDPGGGGRQRGVRRISPGGGRPPGRRSGQVALGGSGF